MVRAGEPPRPEWTYHELGSLPQVLDIVWCRFPYDVDILQPGQKARPVLVRQRLIDIGTRRGALQIAYGTRNLKRNSAFSISLLPIPERSMSLD